MAVLSIVFIALLASYQVSCSLEDEYFKLSAESIDGEIVNFSQFRGMATLVVNTASMCGFTDSHLRDLTRAHDILSHGGLFSVLAFPCNQFGEQEPGDPPQIKQFVLVNYESEFPLFNKVDVIGENAHPVFRNIIAQSSAPPDWNFYKYLVDHTGRVTHSWGPRVTVAEIFADLQSAVDAAKAARGTDGPEPAGDKAREEL
ncbi:glutathione peroxidase 7-like [Pollicipes pollicipes]|uniref:glutathione peroxidase 7-like n=1 Tax=Pollicipes pollicipes TaxID=41117 RepID=UPI001885904A|nr:glutathione peroxidase 7-like [Pollicipes pollicipes]